MTTTTEIPNDAKTEVLDIVYATSPDGRVYELPLTEASKFEVTPEQEVAMGGLPILPYNQMIEPADASNGAAPEGSEVEGRDAHYTPCGGSFNPSYRHYGRYVARCGRVYCGWHYHRGCYIGYPC